MLAANDFRRIALGMRDAVEAAHMGHPDFRVGGRIFATLQANDEWGVVMRCEQQAGPFALEPMANGGDFLRCSLLFGKKVV